MKLAGYPFNDLAKAFALRTVARAMEAFDRNTALVAAMAWGAALVLLLGAFYTLHLSVAAKSEVAKAETGEPVLPKVVRKPPTATEMTPLLQRLQKRFPEIGFKLSSSDQSLNVTSNDPNRFRQWLTVLSYIDTMSPQYRWSIREMCVGGKCSGSAAMQATLVPEKITFEAAKRP